MGVADIRKGMIYKHNELYKECTNWHCQKTGRGSATYQLTHVVLSNGTTKQDNFSGSTRVAKIECDRRFLEVTFIDKETDPKNPMVHLVDEDFDEVTLPVEKFNAMTTLKVSDGCKVTLYTDGDETVKLVITELGGKKVN